MDFEKLERISCLDINTKDKSYIQDSIEDVFSMMSTIQSLDVQKEKGIKEEATNFLITESTFIVKEKSNQSIHLENGFFLAPKVIKRD